MIQKKNNLPPFAFAALFFFILIFIGANHKSAFAAGDKKEMALLPAGEYIPLYQTSDADGKTANTRAEKVAAFWLDARPVTNGEYLAFAAANPKWRKSQAPALFADDNYLAHWQDDITPGAKAPLAAPVVNVSWFAAMAYCRRHGKTLPTTAQWEFAAAASETSPNASGDAAFARRILDWYAQPAGDAPQENSGRNFRNFYGVFDMHGGVWEWTRDFNTALVTGESRGDSALARQLFCGAASLGASDFRDYAAFMRYGFRSSLQGNYAVSGLGFRCARPVLSNLQ